MFKITYGISGTGELGTIEITNDLTGPVSHSNYDVLWIKRGGHLRACRVEGFDRGNDPLRLVGLAVKAIIKAEGWEEDLFQ